MATALYWIVQRLDPAAKQPAFAWVTIFNCKTGVPYTFVTQSLALAFLAKFAATQTPPATLAELRIARIYKPSKFDLQLPVS